MPLGIAHSDFLGWSESDQDKALAWQAERAVVCSSCGTRDSEWRDEHGRVLDPPPYDVDTHTCAGCVELAVFRQQLTERDDVMTPSDAIYLRLVPHDPAADEALSEEEVESG